MIGSVLNVAWEKSNLKRQIRAARIKN
jgi:hypothetical protein